MLNISGMSMKIARTGPISLKHLPVLSHCGEEAAVVIGGQGQRSLYISASSWSPQKSLSSPNETGDMFYRNHFHCFPTCILLPISIYLCCIKLTLGGLNPVILELQGEAPQTGQIKSTSFA